MQVNNNGISSVNNFNLKSASQNSAQVNSDLSKQVQVESSQALDSYG